MKSHLEQINNWIPTTIVQDSTTEWDAKKGNREVVHSTTKMHCNLCRSIEVTTHSDDTVFAKINLKFCENGKDSETSLYYTRKAFCVA